MFFDIGYKEVYKALQESNNHFKREIALPLQIPPIEFTHVFGRFNDSEGVVNDGFEIEYHHKDKPKNNYVIRVKPVKFGLKIIEKNIDQTFKLKDGSRAIYSSKIAGVNLLIFEKDDFQYILSINKKVSNQVPTEVLVEIANSVSY
ncbi:hypothetical protein [Metabacillus litoralis]|uniref:hypothetical protein n=1 Tax=Metabacillus TaxID=2675233 RepID=UPI002041B4F6|nr:hypothetical protein [Metabacillus litoralis]MCM3164536.1 hypothetical protein [Metabacillus litoralis]